MLDVYVKASRERMAYHGFIVEAIIDTLNDNNEQAFRQLDKFESVRQATPEQVKELQVAVGFLLYYGRCVDGRVLPATCALASEQVSPTLSTLTRLQRVRIRSCASGRVENLPPVRYAATRPIRRLFSLPT